MSLVFFISLFTIAVFGTLAFINFAPQMGAKATGERLERMKNTANYMEGIFKNPVETYMRMDFRKMRPVMWEFIKGSPDRKPSSSIHTVDFNADEFAAKDNSGIVVSWFGHSSLLIKIEGKTLLIDPVFDKRASMVSFMGPKRFNYTNYMEVEKLPPLDAVIITHDHYDHLNYPTIVKLKDKVQRFYMPLGVGAHLERWGVPPEHITEAVWWEEVLLNDEIKLICTPTRHFSGRRWNDRFGTLWCSWVIQGKLKNVFLGGDSGYFPGFKEIGSKYGPFDITFLECGAYNENWHEIHMMPEETVQAHVDLGGKYLMPIHWGKFSLSLHPWKEPIQRVMKKTKELNVEVLTPEIGSIVVVGEQEAETNWWEQYN